MNKPSIQSPLFQVQSRVLVSCFEGGGSQRVGRTEDGKGRYVTQVYATIEDTLDQQ
jgi:hypothetical protein